MGENVTVAGDILLVSHTHWDREWYRTFEAFRARLVDTVDGVLDLLDEDSGWRFVLDGQTIIAEDYLAVRPEQRDRLVAAVSSRRLAIGPWHVQPDSLIPSGESHVRNLLEGRRVAESLGGASHVAYAPDSFGHPAQFPQLFAGFKLGPFVYWRGNGDEIDRLGPIYRWEAPDGSAVLSYALTRGYFSAAGLPADPDTAAEVLAGVVKGLGIVERAPKVLMNGVDHMYPQSHTAAVATLLAARTGDEVRRGLLDDLIDTLDPEGRGQFAGDLLGGRLANLLPGVWSSRLGLKLANRRAERSLIGWAEPWSAIGRALNLPDESPALHEARRALLANQAHDSIGGCSKDEVHRQMAGRFATAIELADETTARVLQRLSGLGLDRHVPWDTELDLAVFNPSPIPWTDVVRVALDGFPLYRISPSEVGYHPLATASGTVVGYEANGQPARLIPSPDPERVRMVEDRPPLDVEFVIEDVPAFGWCRVHLAPSKPHDEDVDAGRSISNGGGLELTAADDGTLTLTRGPCCFGGLAAVEDLGDRGDAYDFDPVDDDPGATLRSVSVERRRHPSGIQRLVVSRLFEVPTRLTPARDRRSRETTEIRLTMEARVAPGVDRADVHVELDNPASDHRMRMLFPTAGSIDAFYASTTFDVASRTTGLPECHGWWHPPPETFPHQGWISANGLVVGAPGLPEAEVTATGTIAVTLLRAVGWLSHTELRRRPIPAGPTLVTPDAQCREGLTADLTFRVVQDMGAGFSPGLTAAMATADELGLRAVPAGESPLLPECTAALQISPPSLVLSALKPAEDGDGLVLRILNPTDRVAMATADLGFPVADALSVRLDEWPDDLPLDRAHSRLGFPVGPHALRSIRIRPGGHAGSGGHPADRRSR
jgi:hypothetical protein